MLYDDEGVPRVVQSVKPSARGNSMLYMDVTVFNGAVQTVGVAALQTIPEYQGMTVQQLLYGYADLDEVYSALDRVVLAHYFPAYAPGRDPADPRYYLTGMRLKSISNRPDV